VKTDPAVVRALAAKVPGLTFDFENERDGVPELSNIDVDLRKYRGRLPHDVRRDVGLTDPLPKLRGCSELRDERATNGWATYTLGRYTIGFHFTADSIDRVGVITRKTT
jgi:hypothetical protein